ncbi:MAG: hypothetical protein ABI353_00730 [Isosphaeraceae bacterium]
MTLNPSPKLLKGRLRSPLFRSKPIDPGSKEGNRRLSLLLTVCLALAASLVAGYDAWIGLNPNDSDNLETTLIMVSARQFTLGPGALYGPYSGTNPGVLIQAPLYYRMTALLAWPSVALGIDPVSACLVVGRLISVAAFLACLGVAAKLATIDGAPPRAGLWSALIVLGSPLVGSLPVTVRPDVLGVCLQTLGLLLVARVVLDPAAASGRRLILAYVLFALAFCLKQHFVTATVFCSVMLVWNVVQGRIRPTPVVCVHALALALVCGYYGLEQVISSRLMFHSAFEVPQGLSRVSPGSWDYVGIVFGHILKRGLGLAALAAAALLATSRRSRGGRLDALLLGFVALDLALVVKLCLNSSGAWVNYALGSAVCIAVLAARALDRVVKAEQLVSRRVPIALAGVFVVLVAGRAVGIGVQNRLAFQSDLQALRMHRIVAARSPDSIYFAGGLQPYNRRFGRPDLAHDEWLYGAFERLDNIEPRALWLREALANDPIRLVIVPNDGPLPPGFIAGLDAPLADLGYERAARVGPNDLWERR